MLQAGRKEGGRKGGMTLCYLSVPGCTCLSIGVWPLLTYVEQRVFVNTEVRAQYRSAVQNEGLQKPQPWQSHPLPSQLHPPSLHFNLPRSATASFCQPSYCSVPSQLCIRCTFCWAVLLHFAVKPAFCFPESPGPLPLPTRSPCHCPSTAFGPLCVPLLLLQCTCSQHSTVSFPRATSWGTTQGAMLRCLCAVSSAGKQVASTQRHMSKLCICVWVSSRQEAWIGLSWGHHTF